MPNHFTAEAELKHNKTLARPGCFPFPSWLATIAYALGLHNLSSLLSQAPHNINKNAEEIRGE
ncbi:MAG: hypothetical protein ACLFQG_01110 [Desulfovermiculus sp.]